MSMGNTVGSRPLIQRIDPVTTDSRLKRDEIAIPVSVTSMLSNASFSSEENIKLASYISGYVDGEGCFSISISPRPTLLVGWEVRPSFSVGQKRGRTEVLQLMLRYFQCGTIRNSSTDDVDHYETRNINNIVRYIIPHFEKYPLLSAKQRDFEIFKDVCCMVMEKQHLQVLGLRKILTKIAAMPNISSKRKIYLDNIVASLLRE